MGKRKRVRWLRSPLAVLIAMLLTTCATTPEASPTNPSRPPDVRIVAGAQAVCSQATQVRLNLHVSNVPPSDALTAWELRSDDQEQILDGTWALEDGPLLIAFPNGEPLPPNTYTVSLLWREIEVANHAFVVSDVAPTITALTVATTPGDDIEAPDAEPGVRLSEGIRHFYVRYAYEGGCIGSPYWITVSDQSETTVCRQSGTLSKIDGHGAAACYQASGAIFDEGSYQATMVLMGETERSVPFDIGPDAPTATPEPTSTPAPAAPTCGEPFAAAGLNPDGEPFLTASLFDWYTQVVYVGADCENLQPDTRWKSVWYRQGAITREAEGQWSGPEQGVVWDSLTGSEGNPFLAPGAYTVTLEIGATTSITVAFSIFGYRPANAAEP